MEQLRTAYESILNWWFDLHYSTNQKRALFILAGLLLVLSVFVVFRGNSESNPVPVITPITVVEPEIFVDVTGAVNKPGVYTLKGKSRVIDAIKAAGDSAPGADLSTINLARIVNDGEQIYV
ncbi:MAG: SLBB domain-containing protein, partial [Acidobacteriota bacterium]|nr:SLBB domain-containing protein [Acidobacteriota bacterium]